MQSDKLALRCGQKLGQPALSGADRGHLTSQITDGCVLEPRIQPQMVIPFADRLALGYDAGGTEPEALLINIGGLHGGTGVNRPDIPQCARAAPKPTNSLLWKIGPIAVTS